MGSNTEDVDVFMRDTPYFEKRIGHTKLVATSSDESRS